DQLPAPPRQPTRIRTRDRRMRAARGRAAGADARGQCGEGREAPLVRVGPRVPGVSPRLQRNVSPMSAIGVFSPALLFVIPAVEMWRYRTANVIARPGRSSYSTPPPICDEKKNPPLPSVLLRRSV